MRFDPEYVSQVLNENFEDAKTLFLSPLIAIHYAHLVMLAEPRHRRAGRRARDSRRARFDLASTPSASTPYDGTCEDLFFYIERILVEACGEDVAGRLHTARSRNDIDMTMYRMRQREFILRVIDQAPASSCVRVALDLAIGIARRCSPRTRTPSRRSRRRSRTICSRSSSSSSAMCSVFARRMRRQIAARLARAPSPAPVFPSIGELTSDLLGFDGPTGNTYGSIATVDYLLESASATAVLTAGLGRFVQDLLLWCTAEFGYLRLGEGFVQSSSIMPQKRNPVALEHARAIGSKALGQVSAIMMSVHNTPFGDIVDTEDDLQPLVARCSAMRRAR